MRIVVAIAIAIGLTRPASAHPLDMGYLRLDTTSGLQLTLDLDVNVAAQLLHVEPMALDAGAVAARATELAAATYRTEVPAMDGTPCTWAVATAKLVGRSVSLTERPVCAAGSATWNLPFIKRMSATFQVLAKVHTGSGEDTVIVLDKSNTTLALATTGSSPGFATVLWSGIAHVGLSPAGWHAREGGVPAPLLHLLLIGALVFLGGSILQLLAIGGSYTAGHLLGGALGIVVAIPGIELVGWLVPIAIVVTAITRPRVRERWIAAGVAGVLHGLAIGPALVGAGSLIATTLGIGVAQLAIMLLVGPLVSLVRK